MDNYWKEVKIRRREFWYYINSLDKGNGFRGLDVVKGLLRGDVKGVSALETYHELLRLVDKNLVHFKGRWERFYIDDRAKGLEYEEAVKKVSLFGYLIGKFDGSLYS